MATKSNSAIQPPPPRHSARRTFLIIGIATVLVVAIFLLLIGRWLVVQDPLQKAQAIAVLSGRMPVRAMEAAKLYREGYAPQIWLTHSDEPGATLSSMGISFAGEEVYNTQVLEREGVPASAIRVLSPPIVNTADELAAISSAMTAERGGSVIIVTSQVHTRRVRILWHRLASNRKRAIVRGAAGDSFVPGHWWRDTSDALDVVRECLGILNAWAGMPLKPAR